jgi:hypothetical protein
MGDIFALQSRPVTPYIRPSEKAEPLQRTDIVFLDYLVNRDLFSYILQSRARLTAGRFELIPAEQAYLACCSNFLIRRSSAAHIAATLARIFEVSTPLIPIDLTIRSLIKIGEIRGLMTVPIMGASDWDEDAHSTIQDRSRKSTRNSQRAYLLLRLLACGLKTPYECGQRLAEIFLVENMLSASSNEEDFLRFFDSLKTRMEVF